MFHVEHSSHPIWAPPGPLSTAGSRTRFPRRRHRANCTGPTCRPYGRSPARSSPPPPPATRHIELRPWTAFRAIAWNTRVCSSGREQGLRSRGTASASEARAWPRNPSGQGSGWSVAVRTFGQPARDEALRPKGDVPRGTSDHPTQTAKRYLQVQRRILAPLSIETVDETVGERGAGTPQGCAPGAWSYPVFHCAAHGPS
jgi:hypothetical protein